MTPAEQADYKRRLAARDARQREIEAALEWTAPAHASTKSWRRAQAIKSQHRRKRGNAHQD